MGRKPRINSFIYTYGKFGKGFREILDTENKFLYSHGRYPTKIVAEDLPEDYIKIRSRTLWYMTGFLKTSGIVDIQYKIAKLNHLFKDDYVFISYKEKLKVEEYRFGFIDYVNYDACFCGPDILDIAHAIEKYHSSLTHSKGNEGKSTLAKEKRTRFLRNMLSRKRQEIFERNR